MNVAIILSNSKYTNQQDLVGCAQDHHIISNILKKSGKYELVREHSELLRTEDAIDALSRLQAECRTQKVDELLFYFSGHGFHDGDDFYYGMKEFSVDRLKSTGLSNLALDQILREFKSHITVKIVDACNSGISYIKGQEKSQVEEQLFEKCFFMFSSEATQESFQNCGEASEFTKSIANAILETSVPEVRYGALANLIADDFSAAKKQTPHFVIQSSMTEVFVPNSAEIRSFINEAFGLDTNGAISYMTDEIDNTNGESLPVSDSELATDHVSNESTLSHSVSSSALQDGVQSEAEVNNNIGTPEHGSDRPISLDKNYPNYRTMIGAAESKLVSKDAFFELMNEIRKLISEYPLNGYSVYKFRAEFPSYLSSFPGEQRIGKWLKENKNHGLFADYTESSPNNDFGISSVIYSLQPSARPTVTGYSITTDSPYECIKMEAISDFYSVSLPALYIGFVFSRREIVFFRGIGLLHSIGWDTREISGVSWKTARFSLKAPSEILDWMARVMLEYQDKVRNYLDSNFSPPET